MRSRGWDAPKLEVGWDALKLAGKHVKHKEFRPLMAPDLFCVWRTFECLQISPKNTLLGLPKSQPEPSSKPLRNKNSAHKPSLTSSGRWHRTSDPEVTALGLTCVVLSILFLILFAPRQRRARESAPLDVDASGSRGVRSCGSHTGLIVPLGDPADVLHVAGVGPCADDDAYRRVRVQIPA